MAGNRRKYGTPYKGSKSRIAEKIIDFLPPAHTLVDLFAGGCAITHCAFLSGKWERIIANDLSDVPKLFFDAIQGKYRDERRWISREEFFTNKEADPYIRTIWSFGNDTNTYLYSREIEPYKRACHYAVAYGDFEPLRALCPEVSGACEEVLSEIALANLKERRLVFKAAIRQWVKLHGAEISNPLYTQIGRRGNFDLESLERLQGVERLERLQGDYREIEIPEGSVVYCDIPYNTPDAKSKKYNGIDFDLGAFIEWTKTQTAPLYISEYNLPESDFVCVAEWDLTCSMSATSNSLKTKERIFRPRHQIEQTN